MPIADGVPYWASADPAKYVDGGGTPRWEVTYRPQRMSDYGDFVRFVVGHFAPKGVHTYMIWNEPNHPRFWPSGPDADAYVPMLRAGYTAAKSASPEATILLGGLSKSDFAYLEDVYRAGGGDYFDAVAVQPYTYGVDPTDSWNGVHDWEDPNRISSNAFPAIQEVRASMVAFGDADKDVWLDRVRLLDDNAGRRRLGRHAGRLPRQVLSLHRALPLGQDPVLVRGPQQPVLRRPGRVRGALRPRDHRLGPQAELLGSARVRARPPDDGPRRAPQGAAAHHLLGISAGHAPRARRALAGRGLARRRRRGRSPPHGSRPAENAERLGRRRPDPHQLDRRLPREGRGARKHRSLPGHRPLRGPAGPLARRTRERQRLADLHSPGDELGDACLDCPRRRDPARDLPAVGSGRRGLSADPLDAGRARARRAPRAPGLRRAAALPHAAARRRWPPLRSSPRTRSGRRSRSRGRRTRGRRGTPPTARCST